MIYSDNSKSFYRTTFYIQKLKDQKNKNKIKHELSLAFQTFLFFLFDQNLTFTQFTSHQKHLFD